MKNFFSRIFPRFLYTTIFMLLFLFPACAFAQQETPTPKAVMQAYTAVVLDQQPFLLCNEPDSPYGFVHEQTFSDTDDEWYAQVFGLSCTYSRFCVMDLDADGLPELILELVDAEGYPEFYEIFHYAEGTVQGFCLGLRAMEAVTLEGDLLGSDGAMDNSWYRIQFNKNQLERTDTCHSSSSDTGVLYYIGDQAVTEAEYNAYTAVIEQKDRPLWFAFSTDNVSAIATKFS